MGWQIRDYACWKVKLGSIIIGDGQARALFFRTLWKRNIMSSKHFGGGRIGSGSRTHRTKRPPGGRARRLGFESLEFRRMLATVATPTSVTVEAPPSGQGTLALTSDNNSSTSRELTFDVAGVTAGDTVNVYADGGTTPVGHKCDCRSHGTNDHYGDQQRQQHAAGRLPYLHGHADRYLERRQRQFAGERLGSGLRRSDLDPDRRVGHGRHSHSRSRRQPMPPAAMRATITAGSTIAPRHDLQRSDEYLQRVDADVLRGGHHAVVPGDAQR